MREVWCVLCPSQTIVEATMNNGMNNKAEKGTIREKLDQQSYLKNQKILGTYLMCLLSTAVIYGALLMIFHLL
ncbi:hypothetical protein [Enterobacter soli]|uniref:hypothetical protein n=1 Tax=Enterobacter soli TaxID=885040 RepID=UPI004046AEAA